VKVDERFASGLFVGFLLRQVDLQKQVIEAQQEIIQLRKELEGLKPTIPDDDVNWNKVSGGITATEVLESESIELLNQLNKWIFQFGEKYIRPYVHSKAYAEMIGHMTRGIPKRLAELEIQKHTKAGNSINANNRRIALHFVKSKVSLTTPTEKSQNLLKIKMKGR